MELLSVYQYILTYHLSCDKKSNMRLYLSNKNTDMAEMALVSTNTVLCMF